ncbi:FAD-binding oxidoreductase [Kiloniella laminariae]|uniref:FAD-binding oxidoreductase n=1 Tax=Kiloniella laminariae TaxID=454162 RepID=A0ABT4LMM1_9PROT|nr:FAD-binding oxidoreductase [Kiloniella laminariae]MCZ4282367.1 FAD-binding oxidoreductase [Kiloniella laminariae]
MTEVKSFTHRPYWWADARFEPDRFSEKGLPPVQADVVIVGAGYTGLSAALTLARAGRSVVVLDAERPGWGCSARNGGLLGPSFHKLGLAGLSQAYGAEKARAIMRESMESMHSLVSFIRDEKIDCELNMVGRFRGVAHPGHYDSLARQVESLQKDLGLNAYMVSKANQHQEIGSDLYHGGAVYEDDGSLQPGLLVQGLLERAVAAGAKVYSKQAVLDISGQTGALEVRTASQTVKARNVVVATNGYTSKNLKWFRRRLIPIRSAIIATEALSEEKIRELSPKLRGHGDTHRLVFYYRPSADGRRMIFGGRAQSLKENPAEYVSYLSKSMRRVFPQLGDASVEYGWSGVVAYTFDHAPHVGEVEGVHYAIGYCGSGVGRAVYFGRKAALKILGSPEGRTALDDLSFKSRPLYNGNPWFMPFMIRWHDFADRMGW